MKSFLSILGGLLAAVAVIALALCLSVNSLVEQYGSNYIVPPDQTPTVDAVIIPGARINGDGTPSKVLQNRLDLGYRLYQQGCAKKILVSGDHRTDNYNEVAVMIRYLEELGVPSRDIFADHDGYDTYETMYRAGHVYGVSHAIVATQHYHNVRAVYIGHQLGITTYGVDAAETDSSGSWMTLREYGSRMKAFFQAGIFKPEAKVLGEQIDLFSDGTVTHDQ